MVYHSNFILYEWCPAHHTEYIPGGPPPPGIVRIYHLQLREIGYSFNSKERCIALRVFEAGQEEFYTVKFIPREQIIIGKTYDHLFNNIVKFIHLNMPHFIILQADYFLFHNIFSYPFAISDCDYMIYKKTKEKYTTLGSLAEINLQACMEAALGKKIKRK